jgi:hypothetical protein
MKHLTLGAFLVTLAILGEVLVAGESTGKIFAQQLVEKVMAKRPQISAVELSSSHPTRIA